jgi:hypothetical protein
MREIVSIPVNMMRMIRARSIVMMAATSHLAASKSLHQQESSNRHNQQRADPLEQAGNLLLMMMITGNQVMQQHARRKQWRTARPNEKSCGQPHHNRMPEAAFSIQQIDEHRGFAMTRFQSMQGPEKKAQAKAQFVRMGVNVHTGRIPENVGSETSGTK